jgi:hypothetical protein
MMGCGYCRLRRLAAGLPGRSGRFLRSVLHHGILPFDPSQIQRHEPWHAIPPDHARQVEAKLQRRMCAALVLFERSVTAVGR